MSKENRATPPSKGPVAPTFSALKGGVALEAASWKVWRYRVMSQLHCRLSRYSGPLGLDAAFLLTAGSSLLTMELFYLHLTISNSSFFTYNWSFFHLQS